MRKFLAVAIFVSLGAQAQEVYLIRTLPKIDLDKPGALAALEKERPAQYQRVMDEVRRAERMDCRAEVQLFRAGAQLRRGPCPAYLIGTSYPAKTRVSVPTGDNFGNAYFHMNQRGGVRWSATKAFLRPALSRSNLTLITKAHTRKVLIETVDGVKRAVGVDLVVEGQGEGTARARKAVILAAGSIGSPQILQLSGIGPAELLGKFGIPVVHESAGVGGNLHDHLQIRMVWKVKGPTLNERANSLLGKVGMGLQYLLWKTGPLTMPPSQLGAFAKTDPTEPAPNIEWHVQPLSLDKFGDSLHPFPAITPSVCNLRPSSRGWVRIKSNDPMAAPEIRLNYLSTPEDQRVAAVSMRITREIMKARALARYAPEEWRPGASVDDDRGLVKAAGDLGTTIFHPVGTCHMGSDADAVVDDRLRVRGVENLRVIDASVMPRITSGNTNAPTYMIAERGAEFLLSEAP